MICTKDLLPKKNFKIFYCRISLLGAYNWDWIQNEIQYSESMINPTVDIFGLYDFYKVSSILFIRSYYFDPMCDGGEKEFFFSMDCTSHC